MLLDPMYLIDHYQLILLLMIFCAHYQWNIHSIIAGLSALTSINTLAIGFVCIIVAFCTGEVIDSFRGGILEDWIFDKYRKINWDFFFQADKGLIKKLEDGYFTWYVFNVNTSISLGAGWLIGSFIYFSYLETLILILPLFFLIKDAYGLRGEIVKHTNNFEKANGEREKETTAL